MKREAVLHIPLSNYAFSISDNEVVFRIRTGKDDISSCVLCYGDRSCRRTPVDFTSVTMEKVAFSELFDYYEVTLGSPYRRICYYFALTDNNGESILYYGDQFENETTAVRSEYFQFDYNQPSDRAVVPGWVKESIVYNIFPDSFATGRRYISDRAVTVISDGLEHRGLRGGTINGIRDNLDYISTLGFTCIYINPVFSAGEYHKYDLIDYFHIDPAFGTDEDFRLLVEEAHRMGIRVIIDGVFNHIGWKSDIFRSVVKDGRKSPYWSWFMHLEDPVVVPDNWDEYPRYECFGYERMMPKLNLKNSEAASYFCSVGTHWVEKYDIDGWRLDVACEVCDDFWRQFRKSIKAVKSDCVLIGEVWESAGHWLCGDMFDSTMNYDMRRYSERFFASGNISAAEFNSRVTEMLMRYRTQITYSQLNLLDSHDVSRFLSLCGGNRDYYALSLVFLFTFVGTPCVFYGDEKGLEGVLEDEYRQPMKWDGGDEEIYCLFRKLTALRRKYKALTEGTFRADTIDNDGVYSYVRKKGNEIIRIVLNRSRETVDKPSGEILLSRHIRENGIGPSGYAIVKVREWQ
jgi:cyclomaltodextrinase / maltogenic alpha-amylase / neopullulanase